MTYREAQAPSPSALDVFPVVIGRYADADLADLDVEAQAGRLTELLAPFGGQHRSWRHPVRGRGADAVQHRLREWAGPLVTEADPAGSSVLYWAGHGWSDGTRVALAHAESPAEVGGSGLEPQQLAQAIRARLAAGGPRWAMVIVETSHATQIADAVTASLHGPDAPAGLLLVAVPHDGTGRAFRFTDVLATLLTCTYRAERQILLRDLAAQLERVLGPGTVYQRALGEAALVRVDPPVASWMPAPVETTGYLEEILAELSPDERSHFLVKAQGAEHGEPCWFFEGRENELAQISAWLHQGDPGMLVVTGRAGAGKSALLGTVLVRSLPALRDALARRGLASPGPGAPLPPESVFDAVIHLSGLSLAQAVARVAAVSGIGSLPSHRDSGAGVASDLDFLTAELAERPGSLTVLADALDECLDPFDTARSLLARLAALPRVRLLVGTRASTHDALDTSAGDENLLEALGAAHVIRVGQDKEAIRRYVTGRLRAARDYGVAGRAIPYMGEVSDQDIQGAADEVAGRGQEFLFARLAVYELIADPRLLTAALARSRGRLLHGSHQDLFGRALHRLAGQDDRYPALMRALSLGRGRGVPEADGIWAIIATVLTPVPPPSQGSGTAAAWAAAIGGLLRQAAAYIATDTSNGPGRPAAPGTVYRLAHRTFAEYFDAHPLAGQDSGDPRRLAASALLAAADAAASSGRFPDYLVRHLSGHAAETGMWNELAGLPHVLDRVDPNAVTADAIRTLFGRRPVPPPIAGVIGARDTLAGADPADQRGLRQLAIAMHSPQQVIGEPATSWGIAAAQAGRSTIHVSLSGHTGAVNRVRVLTMPSGRGALASCGDDGTIRLWDPVTATPAGVPMKGHTGPVEDICVAGKTLLASTGDDGTVRLWDAATGQPAGPVITGHVGTVWGMCVLPGRLPGQLPALASAGDDGTVRLWDAATGQPAGPVITGHAGAVLGLCVIPGKPPILASAGRDGTVRLWDTATGQPAGPVITGHAGGVLDLCVLPGRGPDQPPIVVSAGHDGTVRLWDTITGQPAGPVITGHAGSVWGVCALPSRGPDGPPIVVSAGHDGTVRLWDTATGQAAGPVITGHAGSVWGVCALPSRGPDGPPIVASAGGDGTVRFWDATTGQPADRVNGQTIAVLDVCALPGRGPDGPPILASAGEDGTVRLWDTATGQPAGPVAIGHIGAAWSVCMLPGQPPMLASGGDDGTIRVWDTATGQPVGPVITGHTSTIWDICPLPGRKPGQPAALASAGHDGTIRLWDAATGQPAGPVITGSVGGVLGLSPLPGQPPALAGAGHDGTIRLWDAATGQPAGPVITGHDGPVWDVCPVPGAGPGDPPALASAGHDGTVRLWDTVTGQPAGPVMTGHEGPVWDVCAVPGQPPALASAGQDGTVRLWDAATGRAVGQPLNRSPAAVSALAPCAAAIADCVTAHGDGTVRGWTAATAALRAVPSPPDVCAITTLTCMDHDSLLTGDSHGLVHLSNPRTGHQPGPPLRVSNQAVLALCPLPGGRAAAADGTGTITIITISASGQLEAGPVVRGSRSPIRALCPITLPDGRLLLAAAGNDGTIRIWDLATIDPVNALAGHDGWIWSLAAIPARPGHPPLLASAGADRIIRVWDPASGRPVGRPLTGHTGQVRAVISAVSGDGRINLVSGGHDGTIRLWDPAAGAAHAVIPLGIAVHALLQQRPDPSSRKRTDGGATITVGLRTGILSLDLHRDLITG